MNLTMEDERLAIEAVRSGDAARFEELVLANEKAIYNLCLRMLGNEQDALDASQEAFFKAYRSLESFRGDSRFSTWLYRLASNVCLDMLRRQPEEPTLSADDDELFLRLRDSSPSPQEALERNELRRTVSKALSSLPADFRQAVVLRDVNGLSYEEIADVTGLETGTVKSRIFRGRKKLAAVLLDSGNFRELYPSKETERSRGKGGGKA